MICRVCGSEISNDSKICVYCGANQPIDIQQTVGQPQVPPMTYSQPQMPPMTYNQPIYNPPVSYGDRPEKRGAGPMAYVWSVFMLFATVICALGAFFPLVVTGEVWFKIEYSPLDILKIVLKFNNISAIGVGVIIFICFGLSIICALGIFIGLFSTSHPRSLTGKGTASAAFAILGIGIITFMKYYLADTWLSIFIHIDSFTGFYWTVLVAAVLNVFLFIPLIKASDKR